ncbi:unnamed protein product [Ectocarpus fasciculatus]
MKLRWELGALLTVRCFSNAQATTSYYGCFSSFISDGMCDSSNNNAGCDYDGGDCCSCDCFDDTYDCGVAGFICIDPTSSCTYHHYYDDDYNDYSDDFYVSSDDHSDHEDHDDDGDGCDSLFDGDGWCDSWNNNSECDYDGGDCCSCDCIDDNYECGVNGFNCIDPTSSCTYHHYYDDDGSDGKGVGDCDNPTLGPTPQPSTEETPEPTPQPTADSTPRSIPEVSPEPTAPNECLSEGDGLCDEANNNAECNWDGGDCCECDCSEPLSSGDRSVEFCGGNGYNCINPDSSCKEAAPMGVIVGGAVGGAVFLAGVAALVCLLATGRLKCGKCCSSSTSPAVPAAPASGGSASAAVTGFRGPAASSSATAAAPAASASDPPAAAGGSVQDPMSTEREVPVARATPPPAYGESDPPHKE